MNPRLAPKKAEVQEWLMLPAGIGPRVVTMEQFEVLAESWLAAQEALRPFVLEVTEAQRRRGYVSVRVNVEDIDRVVAVVSETERNAS